MPYLQTRDMKLLPKTQRGYFSVRRICRKKIHERISALSSKNFVLPDHYFHAIF